MTIQTETEDQATQNNAPPTPSDTTIHPMAYPDTKLDFEDQNILAMESTDTLDNHIDNSVLPLIMYIIVVLVTALTSNKQ